MERRSSPTSFDCKKAQVLLSAYVDGELSIQDTDTLRAHLEKCPECRRHAKRLSVLSDVLNAALPSPSPTLIPRIMEAVHQTPQLKKRPAHKRQAWLSMTAASLCLVLLVGALALGGILHGNSANKPGGPPDDNISDAPSVRPPFDEEGSDPEEDVFPDAPPMIGDTSPPGHYGDGMDDSADNAPEGPGAPESTLSLPLDRELFFEAYGNNYFICKSYGLALTFLDDHGVFLLVDADGNDAQGVAENGHIIILSSHSYRGTYVERPDGSLILRITSTKR